MSLPLVVGAVDVNIDIENNIDIPYKNWTALSSCATTTAPPPPLLSTSTPSSCYPPVPELFLVSLPLPLQQQQSQAGGRQTTTTATTTTTTTTTTGCHRIQQPSHGLMMRIPKGLEFNFYDTDDDGGDTTATSTEEEGEEQHQLQQQHQKQVVVQQLLVVDLPNYIVKNRGRNFNVDVDYLTGRVVIDGYGCVTKNNLRGEKRRRNRVAVASGQQQQQQQQRKHCLYQEFVIDESMLLPSSSSSSSSSTIWDMTMEMNWEDRKLTLALPVAIIPSPSLPARPPLVPAQSPEQLTEQGLHEEQHESPSRQPSNSLSRNDHDYNSDNVGIVERDDNGNTNDLKNEDDGDDDNDDDDDPILTELEPSVVNKDDYDDDGDGRTMLRGFRGTQKVATAATKVCGLARLSNTDYHHTPPCTTMSTTSTVNPNNINNNNKTKTKSNFGRTFSIRKDDQMNATAEENKNQGGSDGRVSFEDDPGHDHVPHSLSFFSSTSSDFDDDNNSNKERIQSRQDALERFLQFSLGRDEEESYWLRRM